MLEEKAKTLWCPMVRTPHVQIEGVTAVNVITGDNAVQMRATCIASGCMMWRWNYAGENRQCGANRLDTGYCGLGGAEK